MPGPSRALVLATWAASAVLLLLLVLTWAGRLLYPYDLEWMEGGMLAHAWRMRQELPVYPEPGADWAPFIYPPGYAAVLAGLASFVPLHPALGRAVSLVGAGVAVWALLHVLRRRGAPGWLAAGVAACFLGTYPAGGSFLDLVRPDGAYVGLVALAVALALDGRRGTALASGLVIAAAFLVKHNAAGFGLPLLLGLILRDRRQAAVFALASIGPALAMLGYLQWRTEGRFLIYLLEVPTSHPAYWARFWPGTVQELGPALAVLAPAGALALVSDLQRRGPLPAPLVAILPVGLGMLAVTVAGFTPTPRDIGVHPLGAGLAAFGVGALVGWAVLRLASLRRLPVSADDVLVGAVLVTAFGLAGLMRAHNGGYLNVHITLFWSGCLAFGWVAADRDDGWRWAVPGQLLVSVAVLLAWDLVPTPKAREAGDALVASLKKGEGPVLSPYAAWLPTYAGHPPSVHYMALWDLDYENGPYRASLDDVRQGVRRHRWPQAVLATQRFPYGLEDAYEATGADHEHVLTPPTGWDVAPRAVARPKG